MGKNKTTMTIRVAITVDEWEAIRSLAWEQRRSASQVAAGFLRAGLAAMSAQDGKVMA